MGNSASAFSGALTAALDVMAFSHDIDLTGKNKSDSRKFSKESRAMSQNISGKFYSIDSFLNNVIQK